MELEKEHGYVALVVAASVFVNMWLSFKVGGARKKYGVKYPKMYAEGAEADTEKGRNFNCVQRAHQNFLETWAPFMITMLLVAVKMPCVASCVGGIWVFGRVLYAIGYFSGEPKKRVPGGIIATISLLGMTLVLAYNAVKVVMD